MSKQAKAKEQQGYDPAPLARSCGNCKHFGSGRRLPDWMVKANEKRDPARQYTVAEYGLEKDIRCLVGGFAVKKTAVCKIFEKKE